MLDTGVPKENIIAIPLGDEDYVEYYYPHKLHEYIKSRVANFNQSYYVFIDEAQYAISKEEMKNHNMQ